MDKETVIQGLESLRETIRTATQYTFTSGNICAMNMARIDNAIALLKEQVKKGHWIYKKYDDMFMCSYCKKYSIHNDYPYCHWCGAKMDMDDEVDWR